MFSEWDDSKFISHNIYIQNKIILKIKKFPNVVYLRDVSTESLLADVLCIKESTRV